MVEYAFPRHVLAVARVSGQLDTEGSLARFGSAVRETRLARGVSQEALADAAGIDRSHMGKVERGQMNITLLNIARIAKALDCKLSELLGAAGL